MLLKQGGPSRHFYSILSGELAVVVGSTGQMIRRCSRGECIGEPLLHGESSVTLLHPLLPSAGVSIAMERERQQNDRTLADG